MLYNLEIKMGELAGDTILHPNDNGELFVLMVIPERIVSGAEQDRIEISVSDENVVLESEPFKFG